MKKLAIFAFALSMLFAVATPGQVFACVTNAECGQGNTCNLQGVCVSNAVSGGGSGGTLGADIQNLIQFFDNSLVPLIFGVAFIVFLWGVFQYFIAGAADEEKRKTGRTFIMYGIIGFVIMLSIWGIVNLLVNSIGFESNIRPGLPTFGSGSGSSGGSGATQGSPASSPNLFGDPSPHNQGIQ
jgi:hypothetical protein